MEGTSTLISWFATLAILGAAAVYYEWPAYFKAKFGQAQNHIRNESVLKSSEKRQKPKRTLTSKVQTKEDEASTPASSNEQSVSKKRKIISAPVDPVVTATTSQGQKAQIPRAEEDSMSNKEFAEQLAKAQAGTKLDSSRKPEQSKKDRRAAKATSLQVQQGLESSGISTDASSTTGRDADDDMSPSESPASGPITGGGVSSSRDVTDMLQPLPAKATTLRLTGVSESKPKQAPAKQFEPALTKKQRQRQARAEENKVLREEADRIHEAKKQEQLRQARMAAGTSNQSKANAFTASQNVWQQPKSTTQAVVPSPIPAAATAPLLDTFDAEKAQHVAPETVNGSAGQPLSNIPNGSAHDSHAQPPSTSLRPALDPQPKKSWADEMSEEDQIKILKEQADDDAWQSVTSKGRKKNTSKKDNDTGSEASLPYSRNDTNGTATKPNGTKATVPTNKSPTTVNRFDSMANLDDSGLKDSEW